LRFGYSVIAHPATSFKRWQTCVKVQYLQKRIPILLVHSTGDTMVPINHSRQIADAAKLYGVPIETYFTEDEEHCGAYGYNPEKYVNVLQGFLARYLHDDFPNIRQKIAENR